MANILRNTKIAPVEGIKKVSTGAIFAILLFTLLGCQATPSPESSSSPEETVAGDSTDFGILNSEQYKDAFRDYGQITPYVELNNFSQPQVIVAVSTVGNYVDELIYNPYYISGYWEKDKFTEKAVEPLNRIMTDDYSFKFKEEIFQSVKSSSDQTLNALFYNPSIDKNLKVHDECFSEWKEGVCFTEKKPIEVKEVKETENGELVIYTIVRINSLYESEDGTVEQPRVYDMEFTLVNNETSKKMDYKKPILLIDNIKSSLVIEGTVNLFEQGVDNE